MKKNLIVLYGGKSVEHEISIRSAKNVVENINKQRFDLTLIGITKKGDWFLTSNITSNIIEGIPLNITLCQSNPIIQGQHITIKPDIIFPVLHGTDGEDGSVQGFFKVLGIPVVGSNVLGSAVSMDKIVSKMLWHQAGIPVAPFQSFKRSELIATSYQSLASRFGDTFMLKAGNLGSSVGVTKVKDESSYEAAVNDSLKYSNEVLVEGFITGRELECAILGNEQLESTLPGEIILKKDYDFYSYTAKYEDRDAISINIPAAVPDEINQKIRTACERAFRIAHCCDYGRVDLFLTEDNQVIINEINTIPGFTDVSMFPMLWKNMGLDYPELIDKIIALCLDRWEKENELSTSFKD